jgi:hypothetical protein
MPKAFSLLTKEAAASAVPFFYQLGVLKSRFCIWLGNWWATAYTARALYILNVVLCSMLRVRLPFSV